MTARIAAVAAGLTLLLLPAAAAQGPAATIRMPAKLYAPSDLSVLVGTTVTWHNEDSTTHTATADDGSFDSGYLAPSASFTRTFDKPGLYRFHCTIHRFMKGIIRVFGLVLNGPKEPVGVGQHVILAGLAPAGPTSVALQRRGPTGRWETVAVHRARADGGYSFVTTADAPAVYRATTGRASSPLVPVSVFPRVTARAAGSRLLVSTAPARPGALVLLQRYDRERFAFFTAVRGRLGDAGSTTLPLEGLHGEHVRAVVRGSGGWSDGVSGVVLLR